MAVNKLPFSDVPLKGHGEDTAINVKKERRVKRLVHFSDGVLEEYSTDEEEVDAVKEKRNKIDPRTLAWVPYIWFHMANIGSTTLSVCDYLGERLAWMLGITSPKYQSELDEAKRMEEEEARQKKIEDEEYAGWRSKNDAPPSTVHFREPQVSYDLELNKDTVSNISSSANVPEPNNTVSHSLDQKPVTVHQTDILSAENLVTLEDFHPTNLATDAEPVTETKVTNEELNSPVVAAPDDVAVDFNEESKSREIVASAANNEAEDDEQEYEEEDEDKTEEAVGSEEEEEIYEEEVREDVESEDEGQGDVGYEEEVLDLEEEVEDLDEQEVEDLDEEELEDVADASGDKREDKIDAEPQKHDEAKQPIEKKASDNQSVVKPSVHSEAKSSSPVGKD